MCFYVVHIFCITFWVKKNTSCWAAKVSEPLRGADSCEAGKIVSIGVSKNRGTPKWMVKIMENPIKMDDLGGKPTIFGNIHIGDVVMILLMQILRLLNVILLSCDLLCLFFVVLPFMGILTDSSLGKRGPSRD